MLVHRLVGRMQGLVDRFLPGEGVDAVGDTDLQDRTVPNGRLALDRRGQALCFLQCPLAPGLHEIAFRAPGYAPLSMTVEVLAYQTTRLRQLMAPGSDTGIEPYQRERSRGAVWDGDSGLALEVEPADAAVYVDGQQVTAVFDGHVTMELEPGDHRLEIVKPGYQIFSGRVVLRPGQSQQLRVRLDRLPQG